MSTEFNFSEVAKQAKNLVVENFSDVLDRVANESFNYEKILYDKLPTTKIQSKEQIKDIFDDNTKYKKFIDEILSVATGLTENESFLSVFYHPVFTQEVLSAGGKKGADVTIQRGNIIARNTENPDLRMPTQGDFLDERQEENISGQQIIREVNTKQYIEKTIDVLATRIERNINFRNIFKAQKSGEISEDLLNTAFINSNPARKNAGKYDIANIKNTFHGIFVKYLEGIVKFRATAGKGVTIGGTEIVIEGTIGDIKKQLKQNVNFSETHQYKDNRKNPYDNYVSIKPFSMTTQDENDFSDQMTGAIQTILQQMLKDSKEIKVQYVKNENAFYVALMSEQTKTAYKNVTNKNISATDEEILKVVETFGVTLHKFYSATALRIFSKEIANENIKNFCKFWNQKGKNNLYNLLKEEQPEKNKQSTYNGFEELMKNFSSFNISKISADFGFKGEVGEFFTQLLFRGIFSGENGGAASLGKMSFGTGPAATDIVVTKNRKNPQLKDELNTFGVQVKNFPSATFAGTIYIYGQSSLLKNQLRYLGNDLQTVEYYTFLKVATGETREQKLIQILNSHIPSYLRYQEEGQHESLGGKKSLGEETYNTIYNTFEMIKSNFYMINFHLYPASYIFLKMKEILFDSKNYETKPDNLMFHFSSGKKDGKSLQNLKGSLFLDEWTNKIKSINLLEQDTKNTKTNDNGKIEKTLKNILEVTFLNFTGIEVDFLRKPPKDGSQRNIVSLFT